MMHPASGGGSYWPGPEDQRDLARGSDSNEKIKRTMVESILREFDALNDGDDLLEVAKRRLGGSGVLDITEFGRAVHAEMAALMNCARLGVPTSGRWLYCTTFPCHNCAKHIVAAGVERVTFIEPYPKSRAQELHPDSVTLGTDESKVQFRPFVGIGPRRYVDLFSLRDPLGQRIARKGSAGGVIEWDAKEASPILPDGVVSYLEREKLASAHVAQLFEPPAGADT